jgi:hypothetical protein
MGVMKGLGLDWIGLDWIQLRQDSTPAYYAGDHPMQLI